MVVARVVRLEDILKFRDARLSSLSKCACALLFATMTDWATESWSIAELRMGYDKRLK
jgi:hypothetical protein